MEIVSTPLFQISTKTLNVRENIMENLIARTKVSLGIECNYSDPKGYEKGIQKYALRTLIASRTAETALNLTARGTERFVLWRKRYDIEKSRRFVRFDRGRRRRRDGRR